MRHRRPPRHTLLLWPTTVLAVAMPLTACADDANDGLADPGAVGVTSVEPVRDDLSDLSDVPPPENASPFGPATSDGSTTNQSFQVTGSTPEAAIEQYAAIAEDQGWDVTSPPESTGTTDWSATFDKDGSTLLVTTSPAEPDSPDTELSLELTTG